MLKKKKTAGIFIAVYVNQIVARALFKKAAE